MTIQKVEVFEKDGNYFIAFITEVITFNIILQREEVESLKEELIDVLIQDEEG
jgi:hypothetical protein